MLICESKYEDIRYRNIQKYVFLLYFCVIKKMVFSLINHRGGTFDNSQSMTVVVFSP